jgi:redox-regulated HSP33 family molecular chaperone
MAQSSEQVSTPVVRAVREGDEISVAVAGGFARRRAPSDGVIVELGDRDLFVPVEALFEALAVLGRQPP